MKSKEDDKIYDETPLDEEERDLKEFIERGEFKSVPNVEEEKKRYQWMAQQFNKKRKNINIRISEEVLNDVKARANENGLPYQTVISTLIFQYAKGKISIEL